MNIKGAFENITRLSRNVKLILLALLITNLGNGMHTIAVSKLVYDKTNSAMAFGGVIILQYVVMFFMQFLSGFIVDRNNPKKIIIICDLIRGFLIISSGLMIIFTDIGLPYLFFALFLVNVVNPFFNSSNFTLFPTLIKDNTELLRVNGIATSIFQLGQLSGNFLAAPIIYFANPATALLIDGATFFISAIIMCFVMIQNFELKTDFDKNWFKNMIDDWKEIFKMMRKEKSFSAHLFLASGDYLAINFFNLMLVPMVTLWYGDNSFYISLFDGGFSIGAMIFAVFVVLISKKIGTNNSAFVGLFIQGLMFAFIIESRNPILTFVLMLIFGAANSFSVTIFGSNLQQRCTGSIRGRVGSVRNFIVSCLTIIFVPFISKLLDVSIRYGLIVSSVIILTYSIISFILGRKFILGDSYLTKAVGIDSVHK